MIIIKLIFNRFQLHFHRNSLLKQPGSATAQLAKNKKETSKSKKKNIKEQKLKRAKMEEYHSDIRIPNLGT